MDDHGGEVYVYRRTGQPCLVCGTPVRTEVLVGRNRFWCPRCQPRFRSRAVRVDADRPHEDRGHDGTPRRSSGAGARSASDSSLRCTAPCRASSRIFALLVALSAIIGVLIWQVTGYVPLTAMVVPLVLANLMLGPRQLPWFVVLDAADPGRARCRSRPDRRRARP